MRLVKKLICVLLTAVIIVSAVPFAVSAQTDAGRIYPFIPEVDEYFGELKEYIAEGLRARKKTMDITEFNISTDDIIYVMRSVMFDNPDIFYVDSAYIPYKYEKETGRVATISPKYIFTKSKIPSYIKKFNSASEKLIRGIDSSWSDYKKALIIHDRLAANCRYYSKGLKSYTAYNIIVSHKGLCEGYSRAYCHLLSLVGVDSKTINNESQGHCWNMVKLGGYWYHVDVTADDPMPDTCGYIRHKFFLLTDSGLRSADDGIHNGYKSDLTYDSQFVCSSSKYNGYFFRNITSQIVYINGAFYYMNNKYKGKYNSALIKRNGSKKVIKVIKDVWKNSYGNNMNKSPCKLFEYNGKIYFNTKRKIIRYNPKTGGFKRIFTMPSFIRGDLVGVTGQGTSAYVSKANPNHTKYSKVKLIKFYSKSLPTVLPFLKYSSKTVRKKSSFKLKVYYGSGKIKYKSSNPKTARVSSKGKVKALKKGRCTITAIKNDTKLKCKIKVV